MCEVAGEVPTARRWIDGEEEAEKGVKTILVAITISERGGDGKSKVRRILHRPSAPPPVAELSNVEESIASHRIARDRIHESLLYYSAICGSTPSQKSTCPAFLWRSISSFFP